MSTDTDTLRDLFVDVAGAETITEQQEANQSHELHDDESELAEAVSTFIREDGLDDAIEGADGGTVTET